MHMITWSNFSIRNIRDVTPMSSSAQQTHNQANDDQEHSLLAHVTIRPMSVHVSRCAPCRALHAQWTPCQCLWLRRSALVPFVTPLESKWLKSTLHVEQPTPTTIPLTLSSSLHIKGLPRGGGMDSRSLIYWSNPPLTTKVGLNPP